MISNKLLKKQPHPDLDEIRRITPLSDTGRIRRVLNHDVNFENLLRKNLHGEFYDNLEDNIRAYQEKIFAFGVLYLNIINNEIDYKEIINSDFSEVFGFKYNLFLDNYQTQEGFDPQTWLPLLSLNKNLRQSREKG